MRVAVGFISGFVCVRTDGIQCLQTYVRPAREKRGGARMTRSQIGCTWTPEFCQTDSSVSLTPVPRGGLETGSHGSSWALRLMNIMPDGWDCLLRNGKGCMNTKYNGKQNGSLLFVRDILIDGSMNNDVYLQAAKILF